MKEHSKRTAGRTASRLIWLLAGIGVAAGALTLALLTNALVDVQEARRNVAIGREHTERLLGTLDQKLDQARGAYRALLAGRVVDPDTDRNDDRWERSLREAVLAYRSEIRDLVLLRGLDSLTPTVARLDQLRRECSDWGERSNAVERDFVGTQKALGDVLSAIKASVASAQGRARLERIVRLRNARAGNDAGALSSIRDLATDSDLATIRRELADLEVLAQRLAGESSFDRFADLKDNLFKASIDRLTREFAKLERNGESNVPKGIEQLTAFETALFGQGYDMSELHQTVTPGEGGLYNAARQRLALRDERWRLAEAMELELQTFADHRQRLRELGDLLNQRLALGVEESLFAARTQILVVGGVCGTLFILLAATIARSINRQIRAMRAINDELDEAIVHANAANQAKSEFLATMSHEIRTPMNGVLGMTELLLQSGLSSEQHRLSVIAHQSAESLLAVINDVLDFSKVEAGKLELEDSEFDPRQTVEDVTSLQGARAHSKGLELVVINGDEVPTAAVGDPSRVRQVVTNLVANAIKFTEHGEVCVSTQVTDRSEASVTVRIEVRDTGIGIHPDVQPKLFTPFSQADSTMTREYGGTGLGLAISKRLVELMGGEIGFTSEPSVGTTFWFTVQLTPAANARSTREYKDLDDRKILVVDDNETCREILQRMLKGQGAECWVSASGASAITKLIVEAASPSRFEIAIIDLHMPEMDGLELARVIRTHPELDSLKLLLLTSVGVQGNLAETGKREFDGQLPKPVGEVDLYEALTQLLDGSQGEAAQAHPANVEERNFQPLDVRVLVAEDNPVNQEVAIGMLESLGCETTVVGDGLEAVEAFERSEFDVILMDVQMPRLDGYAATAAIRATEENLRRDGRRGIPIIALTANAVKGDRERCIDAGMDDYVSKPFTQQGLYAALQRAIDSSRTRDRQPSGRPVQSRPPSPASDVAGDTAPALDEDVIASLVELAPDGSNAIVRRVFMSYREIAPQMFEQIHEALEVEDPDAVRRAAHSMKSSSANIGALELSEMFQTLETMTAEGSTKGADSLVSKIEAETVRVLAAMQSVLDVS